MGLTARWLVLDTIHITLGTTLTRGIRTEGMATLIARIITTH